MVLCAGRWQGALPCLRLREGDLLQECDVYRCYGDHPKQKFSLKVGTVFEDSPIGLDKWLPAVWLL